MSISRNQLEKDILEVELYIQELEQRLLKDPDEIFSNLMISIKNCRRCFDQIEATESKTNTALEEHRASLIRTERVVAQYRNVGQHRHVSFDLANTFYALELIFVWIKKNLSFTGKVAHNTESNQSLVQKHLARFGKPATINDLLTNRFFIDTIVNLTHYFNDLYPILKKFHDYQLQRLADLRVLLNNFFIVSNNLPQSLFEEQKEAQNLQGAWQQNPAPLFSLAVTQFICIMSEPSHENLSSEDLKQLNLLRLFAVNRFRNSMIDAIANKYSAFNFLIKVEEVLKYRVAQRDAIRRALAASDHEQHYKRMQTIGDKQIDVYLSALNKLGDNTAGQFFLSECLAFEPNMTAVINVSEAILKTLNLEDSLPESVNQALLFIQNSNHPTTSAQLKLLIKAFKVLSDYYKELKMHRENFVTSDIAKQIKSDTQRVMEFWNNKETRYASLNQRLKDEIQAYFSELQKKLLTYGYEASITFEDLLDFNEGIQHFEQIQTEEITVVPTPQLDASMVEQKEEDTRLQSTALIQDSLPSPPPATLQMDVVDVSIPEAWQRESSRFASPAFFAESPRTATDMAIIVEPDSPCGIWDRGRRI